MHLIVRIIPTDQITTDNRRLYWWCCSWLYLLFPICKQSQISLLYNCLVLPKLTYLLVCPTSTGSSCNHRIRDNGAGAVIIYPTTWFLGSCPGWFFPSTWFSLWWSPSFNYSGTWLIKWGAVTAVDIYINIRYLLNCTCRWHMLTADTLSSASTIDHASIVPVLSDIYAMQGCHVLF